MKQLMFILLILITACNGLQEKVDNLNNNTVSTEFQIPNSNYVILDYKIDWNWIFQDAKPTNLSKNELAEIEKIIEIAIKENNEQQQRNLEKHNREYPDTQWTETGFELKTERYKRQYVPAINSNGQKEVWINFFCEDWNNSNWKSEIVFVLDGGNCFFNLKVNLETLTYSELFINGYA